MAKAFNHIEFMKFLAILLACGLPACSSGSKKMDVAAPIPPVTDVEISQASLGNIQPASGVLLAMAEADSVQRNCRFSSFQRKHAIGYEFNDHTHLGLKASPDIDIWNPSDFDVDFKLTFTRAIGGAAKKRPKCTFDGFYGFMPYAANQGIDIGAIGDKANVKSYVEERLEVREQRRLEREKKKAREI